MNSKEKKLEAFSRLLDIMDELREKCPWDRKQTFSSLQNLTVEEVYELSEALQAGNLEEIKKEIGDVLLHLVFYAKIGSESQAFDIADVINSLNEKLIFRHPHIYGNATATTEQEVKENWEKIKLKEGNKSILAGVPKALPSLLKAYRIQDKVKGIGFDFPDADASWKKVEEELAEFTNAQSTQNQEEEMGDILFSLVNHARHAGIDPMAALEKTNKKFIDRFQKMEEIAAAEGKHWDTMDLLTMDALWNRAKESLQQ